MKIVVATDNPGKAREFIAELSEHEVLTSFTRSPPPLSFLAFTHSNKNEGGG